MNKNPILTTYRSPSDLFQLKEWFYNFQTTDNRHLAISRVKSYQKRGKLPHFIEITSLLTSIILTDSTMNSNNNDTSKAIIDENILQLSYSMALIKFVNGLLDPYQKSNYIIPLYTLSQKINLPTFFVELRHVSTHESLPSLELLRVGCKDAVNWLFDNYWAGIEEPARETVMVDKWEEVKNGLKEYKKIRLKDIHKIYKFGDSSEVGTKYWQILKLFKKKIDDDDDGFIDTITEKILTKKKIKFSVIVKLYEPMVLEIGPIFQKLFFERLVKYKTDDDVISGQILDWCKYLVDLNCQSEFITYEEIVGLLSVKNNELNLSLLQHLQQRKLTDSQQKQLEEYINLFKKFNLPKISFLDKDKKRQIEKEVALNNENFKKIKLDEFKFFTKIDNWEPRPFGVC